MKVTVPDRERISGLLENLYLLIGALLIAYAFLNTTTFQIEWPLYLYVSLRDLLIILILLRIGFSERYTKKELLICALVAFVFLFAAHRGEYDYLLSPLLFIVGAKGISWRKILKVFLFTTASLLLVAMISALTGRIENLVYLQEGRRPRMAFGIGYPTDFSAHVFYTVVVYAFLRYEKIKYIEIGVIAVIGLMVYWACDARLNTVCILAAAVILFYHKWRLSMAKKKNKSYEMNSLWSMLLASAAPLSALFIIVCSWFYASENQLLYLLNSVLNHRISQAKRAMDIYGLSIWGQTIKEQGYGGTTKLPEYYFYLDSSYVSILMRNGMMVLGCVLLVFVLIGFKARRERDWLFLWILALVSVQCMVEHHLLEISYVPFLWALFADTEKRGTSKGFWKGFTNLVTGGRNEESV